MCTDEEIDWQDVPDRLNDAGNAARELELALQNGLSQQMSDTGVGWSGQTGLENAYQAILGSHGAEYSTRGSDRHNPCILVKHFRRELNWPPDREAHGEKHQYLTKFGGSALCTHEHPPLDKTLIATDVPQSIRELEALVRRESESDG